MSKDLNKVMLTGYLGADPEMRYTPQGSAVTTFRVASSRRWKSADGSDHDDTEWFRVVSWNKLAEVCNQYLVKGSRVYVEGRLQTRQWTDDEGQTRYSTEVIASDMIILSTRQQTSAEADVEPEPEYEAPARTPDRSAAAAAPTSRSNGIGAATRAGAEARRSAPAPRSRVRPSEEVEDLPF